MTVSSYCSKHTETTTGESLADLVQRIIEKHGHGDRVTTVVTNCEPSLIKAGRILDERHPLG